MGTISSTDKIEIENTVKGQVESDLLTSITNGTLSNDVFNRLTDSKNNYFLECAPTGVSSDEIQSYNVPINSEYTRDSARMDLYKTLVNLCLVIIFMILTYFSVPIFYKYGVVDVINKMSEGGNDKDNNYDNKQYQNRIHRITTVDIMLSLWMIGLILYFLAMSFVEGLWASYIFVILTIVYILSVVVIDGKKKEDTFMTTLLPGQGNKTTSTIYEVSDKDKIGFFKNASIIDFFTFIGDAVLYSVGYGDMNNTRPGLTLKDKLPQVLFIWVAILILYFIPILVSYFAFGVKMNFNMYFFILPFSILLPVIIYFCLFFDVGTEYRRKHGKNLIRKTVNTVTRPLNAIPGTA